MSDKKDADVVGEMPAASSSPIEIRRASFDFQGSSPAELSFKRGALIAITGRIQNPDGSSSWWTGRLQNGQYGMFPASYVEIVPIQALSKKSTRITVTEE